MSNTFQMKVRSFRSSKWANPIRYFFIVALLVSFAIPMVTYAAPTPGAPVYISLNGSGTVGGVNYADDDILKYDGTNWTMYFNGDYVGLGSGPDLTAFALVDSDTALMVFTDTIPVTVGGVTTTANDIVRYDGTFGNQPTGTFSMFMTGATVGLDTAADRIDALDILSDGSLLISTTGNPAVPGVSALEADILQFTPTTPGDYTSGTWSLYFDASDVGLGDTSDEDTTALALAGSVFHLSTLGAFAVPLDGGGTLAGTNQDIFTCTATSTGLNTACTFDAALYLQGSTQTSFDTDAVDAVSFLGSVVLSPTPTGTATNTATATATATATGVVPTATATATTAPGPVFADVPNGYWAKSFIETLYAAGITGGCATSPDLRYCPGNAVTRAEMAVFLLKSKHGSAYNPPGVGASTGFGDVPTTHWAAAWIKQLAAEGITGGCGNGNYCPGNAVTRAEMAVFLLKSKHGSAYNPPAVGGSTGFGDVPTTYWAAAWIKQLVVEGITSGCAADAYCPGNAVTRAEMAVFLVRTFNLP